MNDHMFLWLQFLLHHYKRKPDPSSSPVQPVVTVLENPIPYNLRQYHNHNLTCNLNEVSRCLQCYRYNIVWRTSKDNAKFPGFLGSKCPTWTLPIFLQILTYDFSERSQSEAPSYIMRENSVRTQLWYNRILTMFYTIICMTAIFGARLQGEQPCLILIPFNECYCLLQTGESIVQLLSIQYLIFSTRGS